MVLLFAHAAATFVMVGIVWMVQLVHYPLFTLVGSSGFAAYEAEHSRRMGLLVGGPWVVEGASGLGLLVAAPDGVPGWLVVADLVLLGVVVGVTLAVSVPQHRRLGNGFDPDAHRTLVSTNWLRTLAWTGCGVAVLIMLARASA